jgi:streptogramin lyase
MVRAFSGLLRLLALFAVIGAQTAQAQNWQLTDGGARDIGVGADGTVWVIGTNAVPGGYPIYRRTNNAWVNVPGGAERIAVDPQGNAWLVNSTQTIFHFDGSKWATVAGAARDIGVGANGTVWIIGNNAEAGGYGIYRSTDQGTNWTKIPGSAVRVSVDPQGNAWVVNKANNIFRFDVQQLVRARNHEQHHQSRRLAVDALKLQAVLSLHDAHAGGDLGHLVDRGMRDRNPALHAGGHRALAREDVLQHPLLHPRFEATRGGQMTDQFANRVPLVLR